MGQHDGRGAVAAGPTHTGYRAADPSAYGGRPPVQRGAVVRLAGVQVVLVLLAVAFRNAPVALAVVGAATLLNLRSALPLWRRRHAAPFVVDRPGVYVADADREGWLVHWESIGAVVLCDVTSRRSRHRRLVPGVGLRLRCHPDVVAIRLPLDGWRVDEDRLLAAVARFAPPGVAVQREGPLGEVFTLRAAAEDVVRWAAEAALARTEEYLRVRRSGGPGTPAAPTGPAAFAGPAGPATERPFAVGPDGVHLGPVPGRGGSRGARLVPCADVGAVVVFDAQTASGWHRAVGVVAAGGRGLAPRDLLGYRLAVGPPLDRQALVAAVRLHAPQVPVVDGPPLRRVGAADVVAAVARAHRGRRAARLSRKIRDERV